MVSESSVTHVLVVFRHEKFFLMIFNFFLVYFKKKLAKQLSRALEKSFALSGEDGFEVRTVCFIQYCKKKSTLSTIKFLKFSKLMK